MKSEVVAGRSATIALQLYNDEARAASSTLVTVAVQRADGTVVLPVGTATTVSGIGRYERTLTPAQIPEVDILTATWSVTLDDQLQSRQTTVEVIGAHYFELAELRSMPGLGDHSRFPTTKLAEARTKAQHELERDIGTAFVERFAEATLTGRGANVLRLRPYLRRILGGSVNGVAFSAPEIAAMVAHPSGEVVWSSGYFGALGSYRDVVLRYVYSWSEQPPIDVRDAALELARQHALGWRSFIPDDPVEADDLGRETVSGETLDRRQGQDQIAAVISAWRTRLFGSDELASVQLR